VIRVSKPGAGRACKLSWAFAGRKEATRINKTVFNLIKAVGYPIFTGLKLDQLNVPFIPC
jgi:hypothetical protein